MGTGVMGMGVLRSFGVRLIVGNIRTLDLRIFSFRVRIQLSTLRVLKLKEINLD